jgi:non-heme chloroperoxidase
MPFVKVGVENNADIEIHYRDHGSGRPIVLIHGYPLNGNSWERQERALLGAGFRCISYDRRGFGASSQPTIGYDYDTFAADLKSLLDHLALDQDVVLAGFSMGTGEVTRYLGHYGSAGVRRAVLLGVIPPFLLRTDDNPKGVPGEVFDGIKQAIVADRYAYFDDFFASFYNTDVLAPDRIGDAALRASFQVAAGSSPYATYACVDTWLTDFRADLPKNRRADARGSRHSGQDPSLRGDRGPVARRETDRRSLGCGGGRRSTQHRLDPPGGGQHGAPRLPRPLTITPLLLRSRSVSALAGWPRR